MSNVLESKLHEAVHRRDMEVLAGASSGQVRAYLRALWDTVADFDALLEAGDAVGRLGMEGVESWFCDWLLRQSPDDEMVLDMGGAFLMGYWPHVARVDGTVVERLLAGLELPGLGRNARDSLIGALASAHRKLEQGDLANRIGVCFERIRDECSKEDFQPAVAAALLSVRSQGGDSR